MAFRIPKFPSLETSNFLNFLCLVFRWSPGLSLFQSLMTGLTEKFEYLTGVCDSNANNSANQSPSVVLLLSKRFKKNKLPESASFAKTRKLFVISVF